MRWMVRVLAVVVLGLALVGALFWPPPAWGATEAPHADPGARLFENHCLGCHVHGGNVIRRGRTLKLKALERNGISGPEAIAVIAAEGIGSMAGYGKVLGEGGAEAVGRWVWQQALTGWTKG
jgi:cytochrome c6